MAQGPLYDSDLVGKIQLLFGGGWMTLRRTHFVVVIVAFQQLFKKKKLPGWIWEKVQGKNKATLPLLFPQGESGSVQGAQTGVPRQRTMLVLACGVGCVQLGAPPTLRSLAQEGRSHIPSRLK